MTVTNELSVRPPSPGDLGELCVRAREFGPVEVRVDQRSYLLNIPGLGGVSPYDIGPAIVSAARLHGLMVSAWFDERTLEYVFTVKEDPDAGSECIVANPQ